MVVKKVKALDDSQEGIMLATVKPFNRGGGADTTDLLHADG